MTGTNASAFIPLVPGVSDSGDFSSWLGRPVQYQEETYVMVQCGAAIASGSNGKQLVTAFSSGIATWIVSLCTGTYYDVCGAVPSSLTGAIASGAYFLALRDSNAHVLALIGSTSGTFIGDPLTPSTGGGLINVYTASVVGAAITGLPSTSSGVALTSIQVKLSPGYSLSAFTGTTISTTGGPSTYHAPFRGAN